MENNMGHKIKEEELPLLGESDFNWDVNQEDVGKKVRLNMPNDAYYHNKNGIIKALYRSEEDMPIDAYWICFENSDDDCWFLPNEIIGL